MSRIRFGYWGSQIARATKRPNLLTEELPRDHCPDRYSSDCNPVPEAASLQTSTIVSTNYYGQPVPEAASLQWSYVYHIVLYLVLMVAVYLGRRYLGYFGKRMGRSEGAEEELEPLVG